MKMRLVVAVPAIGNGSGLPSSGEAVRVVVVAAGEEREAPVARQELLEAARAAWVQVRPAAVWESVEIRQIS